MTVKIIIVALVLLIGYKLFYKNSGSKGVSVPTQYPTSLYNPALMTT